MPARARSRMTTTTTTTKPVAKKTVRKPLTKVPTSQVGSPAVVPDAKLAKVYVHRTINGKRDFEIFDFARTNHLNVLMEGPTGPGKTTASEAYAAYHKLPLATIPSNAGIDTSQLFGKHVPDGKGSYMWVDGPVTWVVRNGGLLLWNEINMTPDRIGSVLFGLLDRRRQITLLDHHAEVIPAHKDLFIVADMNPDYEGTRPLNRALRNRFAIQLWWDYDPKVEEKLVTSSMLRQTADQIRARAKQGEFETPVSTNMLIEFEQVAEGLGVDFAIENFVTHFSDSERDPIRVAMDAAKDNFIDELGDPTQHVHVNPEDLGEGVSMDDTFVDENGKLWRVGDVDPEAGIYGVDWRWNLPDQADNDEDDD